MQPATLAPPDHALPFVRDFDWWRSPAMAPQPGGDPYAPIAALHAAGERIVYMPWTPFTPNGSWLILRADDIRRVLGDAEIFSSSSLNFSAMFGERWPMIPIELDPPVHGVFRALLNPMFAPRPMVNLDPSVRALAVALIERVRGDGGCDFVEAFARPFPVQIFLTMMALPIEETDLFLTWEDEFLHGGDMATMVRGGLAILTYLQAAIAARRVNPGDDLISRIVASEVINEMGPRRLTDDEVIGICFLLFIAGLDTVTSTLGMQFRHLAEHPNDQARLRADPRRITGAVEELMRAYSIVHMQRLVTRDVEVAGVLMKHGDYISCPTMGANLDPSECADPRRVNLDRETQRHIAFSYGPHRCLGMHLARRELNIAMGEWLARVPKFGRRTGTQPIVHGGALFGVKRLELTWAS